MAKDLNKHFSMKAYKWPTDNIQNCSTLLIREIKIKITARYNFTPIRIATARKMKFTYWQGHGEKTTLYTVDGNAN